KPENPLILSIDDDQDTLKLIEKYVSKSGFNIVVFDRVAKARTFLEEVKPDLILVDIQMPETNGYEFSLSLQNNSKFSSIPVVFLSVLQREQDKAHAFASGAVDYLTKPIDKEKLIKTIKTNLRKSKEWDLIHRKIKSIDSLIFHPDFKKFRGFLSVKLNPSSDIKNKINDIGVFQLYSIASELGITNKHLAKFIAENIGLSYVPFINPEAIQLGVLPVPFCKKNFVIPANDELDQLTFILSNPFNLELMDILQKQFPSGRQSKFTISAPETIESILKYSPEAPVKKITFVKDKLKKGLKKLEIAKKLSKAALEDSPAVFISDNIIDFAISEGASDIHIEPKEKETTVRFRISGDLRNVYSLKKDTGNKIISRFKVLGGLDITEKRRPQDGVIDAFTEGKKLRLRLATTVTLYGESLIIRLLEPGSKPQSLDKLGMTHDQVKTMIDFINRTDGLILVVGPIGSGKTTTIYSLLFKMDYQNRSLISVEDPVEYEIPFANQQQVNEKAGVTFETLLKSSVRQDPNILFIGEIRDQNSANIAMDFASTSHLTITSLHTSNATTAVFRLERVGISRETIADTVIGIVAQRLLKKLCPHCRKVEPISNEEVKMLSPYTDDIPSETAHPVGCPKCNFTGYSGREGVFEIVKYDKNVIGMVREGAAVSKIREFMKS
ncbi:MAG: ATPase, T2SS/T4P/T4SS family, partial [Nitrospinota bacterium]